MFNNSVMVCHLRGTVKANRGKFDEFRVSYHEMRYVTKTERVFLVGQIEPKLYLIDEI